MLRLASLELTHGYFVQKLRQQRQRLIDEMDTALEEYLRARDEQSGSALETQPGAGRDTKSGAGPEAGRDTKSGAGREAGRDTKSGAGPEAGNEPRPDTERKTGPEA
jgi:hypothetical protein